MELLFFKGKNDTVQQSLVFLSETLPKLLRNVHFELECHCDDSSTILQLLHELLAHVLALQSLLSIGNLLQFGCFFFGRRLQLSEGRHRCLVDRAPLFSTLASLSEVGINIKLALFMLTFFWFAEQGVSLGR